MSICCGSERDTKFCPECGKEVVGLAGLLDYVYERIASLMEREKTKPSKRTATLRAKWKTWGDLLNAVIHKAKP